MIWRAVPGWPAYEVSDTGEVRRVVTGANGWKPRALVCSIGNAGYPTVGLYIGGEKRKRFCVHQLVALAFLGPPPTPQHQVAHSDGSRTNNAASNLRWATPSENQADRAQHGTDLPGEMNPNAKLSSSDVVLIRAAADAGEPQRAIARRFRIHQAQVHRICAGKSWKHALLVPKA